MKKLILPTLTLSLFVLGACKKDYTCTCTVTSPSGSISGSETINDTKSNAKQECESGSSSFTVAGNTTTTSCSLN